MEYYLVQCYKPWKSSLEKQEGIVLAQDLLRKYPDKPSAHALLGGIYYGDWYVHHGDANREKAIASYREYLRLAPANYQGRMLVEQIIKRMQHQPAK